MQANPSTGKPVAWTRVTLDAKTVRIAVVMVGCLALAIAIGVAGGPSQFINVLVTGGMWALLSVGLALVMGVMNIPQFAHGENFMIGAYVAYFVFTPLSQYIEKNPSPLLAAVAPLIAMLVAAVAGFVLGAIIEKLVFATLRHRSKQAWISNCLLIAVGLGFIMTNGVNLLLGPNYRGVPRYWDIPALEFLGLRLPLERLVTMVIALVAISALWIFLRRSDMGRAIRAVAQDEAGAEMVGINLDRIENFTFALSTALAALAGGALLFMFQAYPTVGQKPLYFAWFVVMLVGLGNVAGAVVGAFIVALLQTATQQFIGITWDSVVPTALMIVVLLVAPSGIFGSEVKGIHEE